MPQSNTNLGLGYPSESLVPPPTTLTRANPLTAGVQLGMAGAAAGLSYAALRRAINKRRGKDIPVPVVRPILVGALIGSSLGAGTAMMTAPKSPVPNMVSWDEVHNMIDEDISSKKGGAKYAALNPALDMATYFTPGVGSVRMAWDAMKSGKKGWQALAKGNLKGFAGHGLASLGNLGFAASALIPGVGGAVTAAKFARIASKARRAKMMAKATGNAKYVKKHQALTGKYKKLKLDQAKSIKRQERFGLRQPAGQEGMRIRDVAASPVRGLMKGRDAMYGATMARAPVKAQLALAGGRGMVGTMGLSMGGEAIAAPRIPRPVRNPFPGARQASPYVQYARQYTPRPLPPIMAPRF